MEKSVVKVKKRAKCNEADWEAYQKDEFSLMWLLVSILFGIKKMESKGIPV